MTMENKVWNIGDILEREYGKIFRDELKNYNEIWERYIGHISTDSNKKDFSEPEKKRRKFAQQNYSCFESIVYMNHCIDEIKKAESAGVEKIGNYIMINNLLMSFFAHIERVHDDE